MKVKREVKRLGDVCDKSSSNISQNQLANEDGAYPIFGAGGFIKNVSFYHQDKEYVAIIKDGAGIGRLSLLPAHSSVIGTLQYLVPKDILNIRYFFYFLSSIDFGKYKNGSTIPHIYFKDYADEPILVLPIPEQKRIVAVLDEAFDAIAKAKENAEKNLSSSRELFKSYLQSELLNNKWEQKLLGEVCEDVEYGTSSKSKKNGKVPVLRMGNIQNGRIDWTKLVYSDDKIETKKYLLKHNDVLFNRTNSPEWVGKTAIYKSERPAIFAGYLIRIHRKEKMLDADYLNYFLNSDMAMKYGKTVTISSVNQANINGAKLMRYPIPVPPIAVQKNIVKRLNSLATEIQRIESVYTRKLADLEELKKSILQKAFSGELAGAKS
ncbi:MAG: hypothetical protein A2X31_06210 [Elusimicrobia bacterium GWB2_63_22]|nr:MAG: hypothetical protein A2X31_06210 [Elusimicrobia bacterium GWB2_63_22]